MQDWIFSKGLNEEQKPNIFLTGSIHDPFIFFSQLTYSPIGLIKKPSVFLNLNSVRQIQFYQPSRTELGLFCRLPLPANPSLCKSHHHHQEDQQQWSPPPPSLLKPVSHLIFAQTCSTHTQQTQLYGRGITTLTPLCSPTDLILTDSPNHLDLVVVAAARTQHRPLLSLRYL